MQQAYDLQTIIIIITFLSILIFISIFIKNKKDFIKNHFKNDNKIDLISSFPIGNGNKATLFEVYNKQYLIVSSKNNISNILEIENSLNYFKNNNEEKRNEMVI